jgi:5-methylcytosine-specific restriction protein A
LWGLLLCQDRGDKMPRKPKKPCGYPGCPELTDKRYCSTHQRLSNKHYNKYMRDPVSNKRYGRAWKRIRDRYIKAHPLCEACKRQGRLTPVEEVHHIKPLSQGGSNDFSNLMSLCKSCHSSITAKDGDRWGRSNL